MKTPTTRLIAEYKFQDRKNSIWLLPAICTIVSVLMLMADPVSMLKDGNVIHSLLTASIVGTLLLTYNWRNREMNILILIIYLISVGMEFSLAGIPEQPIKASANYNSGKGAMMEIFIYLLPFVYSMLKVGIALPLYLIVRKS